MIIRDSEWLKDGTPSEKMIKSCIKEHEKQLSRLNRNDDYWKGKHTAILKRTMKDENIPNNKLVCNHARVISITACSHLIGEPVKYTPDDSVKAQFEKIKEEYDACDIASIDAEIEQDCSVFGRAVELVYASDDDKANTRSIQLDPRSAFVVYDDTVEHKRLFGVHYYEYTDEEGEKKGYKISVRTKDKTLYFKSGDDIQGDWEKGDIPEEPNNYYDVPMFEYLNNEDELGDFEGQISLIDAYNMLASDRINDKEAFVDAVMYIKGQNFGDDLSEASKTMKALRELHLLELDENGEAGYLTKQLIESDCDILRRAISEDIHRFSMVPNVADENFAGNASGVAMQYKLLLLEELTKVKERYFRRGLQERLRLYGNNAKTGGGFDAGKVKITFTHLLPVNQPEVASTVSQLAGIVPDEDLYSLLWFIDDPKQAIEKMYQQNEEKIKMQQRMMTRSMNFGTENPAEEENVTEEENPAKEKMPPA